VSMREYENLLVKAIEGTLKILPTEGLGAAA